MPRTETSPGSSPLAENSREVEQLALPFASGDGRRRQLRGAPNAVLPAGAVEFGGAPAQSAAWPRLLAATLLLVVPWSCDRGNDAAPGFDGPWVLDGKAAPMGMEVQGAGTGSPAGSIVGAVGGRLQPFLDARVEDGRLTFRVARTFNSGTTVESSTVAWLEDGRLRGETIRGDRAGRISWTGRRPDEVTDTEDDSWTASEPVVLLDEVTSPSSQEGSAGLTAWHLPGNSDQAGWVIDDGVLRNVGSAADLRSRLEFWNFELGVEYRISSGGNSGIGLRGRYEVQILDDHDSEPSIHGNGAIYSRIAPSVVASRPHSEWQVFRIRLVGRTVTVVLNGTTIVDRKRIEGITAMARDARESKPGPILLQGDHGPVEFRRIVVTPLVRQ